MKIDQTSIPGVYIFTPRVFGDERGYFFESYRQDALRELGIDLAFIQDNQSCSQKNVLRGLHFQRPPFAQGKLVRVARGRVLDVAVDLRSNSATYAQSISVELNAENHRMIWIPPGFAHGFLALEDQSVLIYKQTHVYDPQSEGGIRWNDPTLGIDWPLTGQEPLLSPKDAALPLLKDLGKVFD